MVNDLKENWKSIEIFGKLYYISDFGNVKSEHGKPISCRLDKKGYLIFTAGVKSHRRKAYVHRFVAILFVDGYVEGYDVNHKDYNRRNPAATNLEWITHKENVLYSADNRADVNGDKNPNAKLTVEDVLTIRELIEEGYTISSLALTFGMGRQAITRIKKRESWKYI